MGIVAVWLAVGSASAADWYERGHGRAPTGGKVYICHGYTCRIVTPVQLTPGELKRIARPMAGVADAAAERAALAKSVQLFEQIVGARVGTAGDLPGMQFGRGADGQMDCIDEATNTMSLLLVLQRAGYLRHHRVLEPKGRGFFLDGRYPHATAAVADTLSGASWAIDSWPGANGEPPLIQPLADWFKSRSGANPS